MSISEVLIIIFVVVVFLFSIGFGVYVYYRHTNIKKQSNFKLDQQQITDGANQQDIVHVIGKTDG